MFHVKLQRGGGSVTLTGPVVEVDVIPSGTGPDLFRVNTGRFRKLQSTTSKVPEAAVLDLSGQFRDMIMAAVGAEFDAAGPVCADVLAIQGGREIRSAWHSGRADFATAPFNIDIKWIPTHAPLVPVLAVLTPRSRSRPTINLEVPMSAADSAGRGSAAELFGERLPIAQRYAELLADTGVAHGLIGPREGERVWERHVLNCVVLVELIEPDARVLDIGSGAGLPGIPLAIARPDLEIVLLEPMARRVDWLRATVEELKLPMVVARGRAEEPAVVREWSGADVVTARAVAPLSRLAGWALPLLRTGGRMLAIKGASADTEVARDRAAVRNFGGSAPLVVQCGGTHVEPPTTVVVVERTAARVGSRSGKSSGKASGMASRMALRGRHR